MLVTPDEVHAERDCKYGRCRVSLRPLSAAAPKRSLLGDPQPKEIIQDLNTSSSGFINKSNKNNHRLHIVFILNAASAQAEKNVLNSTEEISAMSRAPLAFPS